MCRLLEVSRSSYYNWLQHPIGKRLKRSQELDEQIKAIYFKAKGRYGSPRITEVLNQSGIRVSRPTVAKHMKHMGIKSKFSRKYIITTDSSHKEPVAENIFNRDFAAISTREKCVSDIMYLPTKDRFCI